MNHEAYCANLLKALEAEFFIAVGDARVAGTLNPAYQEQLRLGKGEPLPDLLSVKKEGGKTFFRLREVKFKLEERLIRKALRQLDSGIQRLLQKSKCPVIDRVEIVVPLQSRKLKPQEEVFLGEAIASNRYRLKFPDLPTSYEVTILLL